MRRGLWEPLIYSHLVWSTGNNLGLWLASKVEGNSCGTEPFNLCNLILSLGRQCPELNSQTPCWCSRIACWCGEASTHTLEWVLWHPFLSMKSVSPWLQPYKGITYYFLFKMNSLYQHHHLFNIYLRIIKILSGNIHIIVTTTIYYFQIEYSTSLLLTLESCECNCYKQILRFSYFSNKTKECKVIQMWSRDWVVINNGTLKNHVEFLWHYDFQKLLINSNWILWKLEALRYLL